MSDLMISKADSDYLGPIPECNAACPLYETSACGQLHGEICSPIANYLQELAIFVKKQKHLTDKDHFFVGMHIIPQYRMLCKMQIYEMSVTSMVRMTDKGSLVANPIYKEIRSTVDLLLKLWKSVGLDIKDVPGFDPPNNKGKGASWFEMQTGKTRAPASPDRKDKK